MVELILGVDEVALVLVVDDESILDVMKVVLGREADEEVVGRKVSVAGIMPKNALDDDELVPEEVAEDARGVDREADDRRPE